jgi:16S rRNA processing protein RimM
VAARSSEQRVCVARLGAAHGVRGEVRLWSFTAAPAAVVDYGPFETADGRAIEIETLRPAKDFFVARLKGIADRNAAESLRNVELFVPRARLPAPADDDEFYHADLIGLAVVDPSGAALGTIVALHNFGAGDIVEIRRADANDTVMLLFTQDAVPEIDVAGGRVVVARDVFEAAANSEAQ